MVSFQPRLLVSEAGSCPTDGITAESASDLVSLRLAGSVAVWVRVRRPQLRERPHSSKRSLSGPPSARPIPHLKIEMWGTRHPGRGIACAGTLNAINFVWI